MMQLQRDLVTECVEFLKTISKYLRECEESHEEVVPQSLQNNELEDDQTYLNVFHEKHDPGGERDLLITQCEALLERFEKSISLISLGKEINDFTEAIESPQELEDEEENSYLDMSGTNTLKPNTSSSSNVSIGEVKEECATIREHDEPNEEEMLFETAQENSYDLTTDQILYDECLQEVSYEQERAPGTPPTPPTPTPEIALHESQCPFGGLPASHLRLQQSPKHGTLFKQEKRLFFDQFKKYYVGLIGKWLLVYNSHNDLKPLQTIFIKSIKLDLNLNEQINEKHLFQIITHTDTKVHFLSPSFQDLNEWIVAIENNLIEKVDQRPEEGGVVLQQVPRKLPLPPCPQVPTDNDETDLHVTSHVEDGIYEEPSLCLKPEESGSKSKVHGYDTPKPCCTGSSKPNACTSASNSKRPDLPVKTVDSAAGTSTPTPVKSWLKNRFNRSPPEPSDTKLAKKALKKLSFEELSVPEGGGDSPKSPTKQIPVPTSPKFSLATTPASKGTKINMIISQLEANGQLNLLSKRLTETNKRYTWVADGVTS